VIDEVNEPVLRGCFSLCRVVMVAAQQRALPSALDGNLPWVADRAGRDPVRLLGDRPKMIDSVLGQPLTRSSTMFFLLSQFFLFICPGMAFIKVQFLDNLTV